ncbi:3-galactosyl-N-acetylglucosaminide 4-alpha-L-fucosyltransferase FUT3-like isoform 1-T2 [Anomaloglossus baeobatrachus]|uniref:3-galactosyl-N-acetylglucosaminide 4-alpha-L-fucosyltransferase FUT3-like n=1 Tax=Anomaloglossus baeobatrachus TaxID=238106 RepID=UPI003F5045F5
MLSNVNQSTIIITILFFSIFFVSYNWKYINMNFQCPKCQQSTVMLNKDVQNVTSTKPSSLPPPKETLLLVWNWPWGAHFPLDKCETEFGISGCKLATDRSLYNVADAVIIHHADIGGNKYSLPQQPRNLDQRWVWLNLEPPLIISNLDILDNLFNMTMTFHHDSDIYTPYGHIESLRDPQNFTIPAKSKLVSWVVSKWYPGIRRIAYYEELRKHISIDVYGAKHKRLDKENFQSTIAQYKFYLAFENSIYPDYITEKLWVNALGSGAVPVVLGTSRENYERFVPRDAFIHVDDFPTAKELAAYLLELDKDDEKYRKYFHWRSRYRVRPRKGWPEAYCKACEIIKQGPRYQVIRSVAKWFLDV